MAQAYGVPPRDVWGWPYAETLYLYAEGLEMQRLAGVQSQMEAFSAARLAAVAHHAPSDLDTMERAFLSEMTATASPDVWAKRKAEAAAMAAELARGKVLDG